MWNENEKFNIYVNYNIEIYMILKFNIYVNYNIE